jgi:hypothetical protein
MAEDETLWPGRKLFTGEGEPPETLFDWWNRISTAERGYWLSMIDSPHISEVMAEFLACELEDACVHPDEEDRRAAAMERERQMDLDIFGR